MKKARDNIKTTKKEIIEYWMDSPNYANGDEVGMAIDQADLDEDGGRCWRCGTTKNVQRCHIIPHSQGGRDEPSNLLLLCRDCHNDAPNVSNATAEDFFNWMKNSRHSLSKYLNENNAGYLGMLRSYPPKGQRGEFWSLKVIEIGLRDYDFNITQEKGKLSSQFHNFVNERNPNPVDVNSLDEDNINLMFLTTEVFNNIMFLINEETKGSLHFKQEGGNGQDHSSLQTEALANINNIKSIKSLMEEKGDNFISYLTDVLGEELLEKFNKKLGFDFFIKKVLTPSNI
jgi:hypothetical protein